MSKLRIFIEGKELDSLESVTVPITKQFEELSDPTVICNDYSKTVTVPLSKNNNEIFGHCYNPDRLIAAGDENTPLVGIYFDPYKKLDCRLQWGDDVFFTGYAKMLKVTNNGYEVTINGELGKIFQELQKITFDKTKYEDQDDIDKYWIDGSKYVNTQINKELVYKCWNSEQDDFTLRETTDSNYDITDIIGFIANNSYSNDFDYKTVELNDGTSKSISDVLGETFETNTGYSRESVIGEGLLPVCMYQYRSYEQIPFIYWNKFWQIFQKKAKELTGYSWDLDGSWFTTTNKNYSGLGVTLLQRDSMYSITDSKSDSGFNVNIREKIYNNPLNTTQNISLTNAKGYDAEGYNVKIGVTPAFSVQYSCETTNTNSGFFWGQYGTDNRYYYSGLIVKYIWTDSKSSTTFLQVGFCCDIAQSETTGNALHQFKKYYPNLDAYYTVPYVTLSSQKTVSFSFSGTDKLYSIIRTKGSGGNIEIQFQQVAFADYATAPTAGGLFTSATILSTGRSLKTPDTYILNAKTADISINYFNTYFRSNDEFTLNDICNFDFSNILDYCKRYRIHIYVDEVNKKLKFSKSLFSNYTIVDKTEQIDNSTFEVSPITFKDKYVLFGYDEPDTQLGKLYKNLYNYTYGAKRLETDYNFNTETNKLFEKSQETILYSPTSLNWFEIYVNHNKKWVLNFWVLNNNYLECRDESGKTKDISVAYFYPVKREVDHQYGPTIPWITDDSTTQILLDKYYNYENTSPSTYGIGSYYWTSPELVLVDSLIPNVYFTCLWEKPKKNYVAQLNYYDNAKGLFKSFWETYLNERYNVQNKKVTTYVRLTPSDFINFNFNQFWKIGNQIYIVNKIYDYDITSDEPTKVDLITVQNINAYK